MVQKWNPIFFHIQGEKIFVKSASDRSWTRMGASWTSKFRVLARLGALLDRFQFFFGALEAPLGPVRAWSRTPRRPPRRLLEASYTGKTHNSASYAVKSITSKIVRFMLVKRTILKIHLPSFCIPGPIFSTCSSFEHQYTSRSIQLHLGNAVCHMSDPLRDPFFAIMIGPKNDLKIFLPQQDGKKIFLEKLPGGVGNGSRRGTQNRNYQGVLFFFFLFFFSFLFLKVILKLTLTM